MATTQYIGARYVPIFGRLGENSIQWDNTATYEPLTVVLHQGNSYTSRQFVPVGIEIDDQDYWAETGNYNAQIEQYRQDVQGMQQGIDDNTDAIEAETTRAKAAEEANAAAIEAEVTRAKAAEEANAAAIEAEVTRAKAAEEANAAAIESASKEASSNLKAFSDITKNYRMLGGTGNLVYVLNLLVDDMEFEQSDFVRSKLTNSLFINVVIKNNGETIDTKTPLFNIPNYSGRYASTALYAAAFIVSSTGEIINVATPSITESGDFRISAQIPQDSKVIISNVSQTSNFLDPLVNDKLYPSSLATNICNYFLNGGTKNWKGQLNYSNTSGRLTPETSGQTDCSGLFYSAYNYYGIHPVNSVQASYAVNGIPISFAKSGEPLDMTNALPGDAILYQNPELDQFDQASWTHCSIYAGNNITYEMASTYPTGSGGIDGKGPFEIMTPADVYRMDTRNRLVVRFL